MNYWLVKSEPFKYSWEQFVKDGKTFWDGVRNYGARNNLKAMKKGDLGFFYHTGDEKRIVGIVEVIGEYRPDPTDEAGKFGLVVVKAVKDMPRPVTLATIKATPELANLELVRLSRLSVSRVGEDEWKLICKMGGL